MNSWIFYEFLNMYILIRLFYLISSSNPNFWPLKVFLHIFLEFLNFENPQHVDFFPEMNVENFPIIFSREVIASRFASLKIVTLTNELVHFALFCFTKKQFHPCFFHLNFQCPFNLVVSNYFSTFFCRHWLFSDGFAKLFSNIVIWMSRQIKYNDFLLHKIAIKGVIVFFSQRAITVYVMDMLNLF